jgi:hypothetical protein
MSAAYWIMEGEGVIPTIASLLTATLSSYMVKKGYQWERENSPESTELTHTTKRSPKTMSEDQTESKPEGAGLSSSALLAEMNARLGHAEARYYEEQNEGDAVSIASTRAAFCSWRDARDIVKRYFQANTQDDPHP